MKACATLSLSLVELPAWASAASSESRSYQIHHLSLQIVSNQPNLLRVFDALFGCFFIPVHSAPPLLTVSFYEIPPQGDALFYQPAEWVLYGGSPQTICYTLHQSILYRYREKGLFCLNFADRSGIGYITTPYARDEFDQMYRKLILPSLFNLIRAQGVFFMHAAALIFEGKGIVIAGDSGKGKTTLLLHLLNMGGGYLADDTVILREQQETVEILAFPTAVRVTAQTGNFFPELQDVIRQNLPDERGKYRVNIVKRSQSQCVCSTIPTVLLFPEITNDRESTLHPISRMEAAVQCIPANTLVSDTAMSRQNFAVLSRLVQNVKCYRVRLGQDMRSIGRQILDMIIGW